MHTGLAQDSKRAMDVKGKSSNERSEEEGHEESSGDDGSTRRKSTAAESDAVGPSASVSETAGSRFASPPSPPSPVDDRQVEPPHRRPALADGVPVGEPADPEVEFWEGQQEAAELVSEDVIDDVCRMYCNVIARETYRINSMSQPPNFVGAFRALTRLGFPSSFQDAFKARYAGVAGDGGRIPPVLRDGLLLSADAQVPDYLKNIIDAYGLSGVFADEGQPDVVHVDDQEFVCESDGRSEVGCRGRPRPGRLGNARRPFAPSRADDSTDSQPSGSDAKEQEEVE